MTIIKWPGGKTSEFNEFSEFIPEHTRYIEPFFGGGAVFFKLKPQHAIINDISTNLTDFYSLVKNQDSDLEKTLLEYNEAFLLIQEKARENITTLLTSFEEDTLIDDVFLHDILIDFSSFNIIKDFAEFINIMTKSVNDKIKRTKKNHLKKEMIMADIQKNLVTGFTSGFYLYTRKIYNDIQLNRAVFEFSTSFKVANFYWIREYCYGSMFRYNKSQEFNIPYGGISYNEKNFKNKLDKIFSDDTEILFENTKIYNTDFEKLLTQLTLNNDDFIFLDPPYDTEFSEYEGREFGQKDQIRLQQFIKSTDAKVMLVIKNTEFIYNLYNSPEFNIVNFDKTYTYNVRSRNTRNVDHLIICNY